MQKHELENFMRYFVPEIDFTIELENRSPVGIAHAEYEIDAHGNGHVKLIPACELFAFGDYRFELSSTWDCGNPFGKCVYNTETDPARDNCIFCGQPHERK